jgi:bacterioferritin
MGKSFRTDIKELRRRARSHIEEGAVTEAYRADRETVLRLLSEALATESLCVLRYKRHYYMASGIHAQAVAEEFREHAGEEQGHADLIAERLAQLGGEPDLNPEGLPTRSHSESIEGEGLLDMIKEDLVAERVAIDSYAEMIRYIILQGALPAVSREQVGGRVVTAGFETVTGSVLARKASIPSRGPRGLAERYFRHPHSRGDRAGHLALDVVNI